jgi:hypothetical protein
MLEQQSFESVDASLVGRGFAGHADAARRAHVHRFPASALLRPRWPVSLRRGPAGSDVQGGRGRRRLSHLSAVPRSVN